MQLYGVGSMFQGDRDPSNAFNNLPINGIKSYVDSYLGSGGTLGNDKSAHQQYYIDQYNQNPFSNQDTYNQMQTYLQDPSRYSYEQRGQGGTPSWYKDGTQISGDFSEHAVDNFNGFNSAVKPMYTWATGKTSDNEYRNFFENGGLYLTNLDGQGRYYDYIRQNPDLGQKYGLNPGGIADYFQKYDEALKQRERSFRTAALKGFDMIVPGVGSFLSGVSEHQSGGHLLASTLRGIAKGKLGSLFSGGSEAADASSAGSAASAIDTAPANLDYSSLGGTTATSAGGLDYSSLGTQGISNGNGLYSAGTSTSNAGLNLGNTGMALDSSYQGMSSPQAFGDYSSLNLGGDLGGMGTYGSSSPDPYSSLGLGNTLGDISSPLSGGENSFLDSWNKLKNSALIKGLTGETAQGLMPLAKLGLGAYMNNKQKQQASNTYRQQRQGLQDTIQGIKDIYTPNSPYAQQMQQQLERQDAVGGRRSQYGTRSVELAARLAQAQSQALGQAGGLQQGMTSLNDRIAQLDGSNRNYLATQLFSPQQMANPDIWKSMAYAGSAAGGGLKSLYDVASSFF